MLMTHSYMQIQKSFEGRGRVKKSRPGLFIVCLYSSLFAPKAGWSNPSVCSSAQQHDQFTFTNNTKIWTVKHI